MIRKFNYTQRRRIDRDKVSITLTRVDDKYSFTAALDKENLKFPNDSKVYIEPYYGPNYLRFPFGTFNNFQQPSNSDITELKLISEKIYFRIKIVDESQENGLLLGFADKLPLVGDGEVDGKSSILYVNPVKLDTDEVWRINFQDDDEGMPHLEVNNSIEGIKELARTDRTFIALVYPAAIRQILQKIVDENSFEKEGEKWTCKWIQFTENVLKVDSTPINGSTPDDNETWIEDAVRSFCKNHRTLDFYIKSLSQ